MDLFCSFFFTLHYVEKSHPVLNTSDVFGLSLFHRIIASYMTLITALRETAQKLRYGAPYAWGHHGQCNCGNLAQTLTPFSDKEIQRYAQAGVGEWTELAQDYCGITGAPADLVLHRLMEAGLTPTDIHHLEYLNDRKVLAFLPGGFRWLRRNQREDAILYFEAKADMLENQLLDTQLREALEETACEALAYA